MSRKNINFNDKKIRKSNFYENKKKIQIDDIDANNILVSEKESYGNKNSFKYFIGYNDNDIIRQLCIEIPQMTGYFKKFNKNLTLSFRVTDKQLLKNSNRVWEKIEKLMKIDGLPFGIFFNFCFFSSNILRIYFSRILFFYFYLLQIGFYMYLLPALLVFFIIFIIIFCSI